MVNISPIVNIVKNHKLASIGVAAVVGVTAGIGGSIFTQNSRRISAIEEDTFVITKNIGGNEYKAFGDTEALDKFSKGIAENKTKLMKELNISEENYQKYTQVALALADVETDSGNYLKYSYGLRELFNGSDIASAGLTNIKVDKKGGIKSQYQKFGIQDGSDIHKNPYKAGVATIIKINDTKRQYGVYCDTIDKNFPNLPKERKLSFEDYCFVVWKGKRCIEKGSTQKKATETIDSIVKIKNGGKPESDFEREYKAWRTRLDQCK